MSTYVASRINGIRPFLAAVIAILTAGLLIVLSYFMQDAEQQLIPVLWMVLVIALVVMMVQIAYTEKAFSRQLAQLSTQKERLANEIKYRIWAEKTSSENKARLQIVDENLPVMLAYFGTEQQCQYHNRAFRQWFGLKPEQIDGRFLSKIFSGSFCASVSQHIEQVLTGETIQSQHVHKLSNQSSCLIASYLIPHFNVNGKVIGFYTLFAPRLLKKEEELPAILQNEVAEDSGNSTQKKSVQNDQIAPRQESAFIDSSTKIIRALEQGGFRLYCQQIVPVSTTTSVQQNGADKHYEILLRMAEEESNHVPPGAFLPFVEKHNLMPRLDRWVVEQAVLFLQKRSDHSEILFCINVAASTLRDEAFADDVLQYLATSRVDPRKLCFEIEVIDTIKNLTEAKSFARKVSGSGCRITLCSFKHHRSSYDLLRHIRADFLKIDGSLINNMLHDADDLEKIEKISQFARTLKLRTIGELVETQDIFDKLAEIGVHYAQGFSLGRPQPLEAINN